MQFRILAIAALVAGAAAQNYTNATSSPTLPTPTPTGNAGYANGASFVGLGLALAGAIAAAF